MIRDFSAAAEEELLNLVDQVEAARWNSITDSLGDLWYGFLDWIGELKIENYLTNISDYHMKVIDKNNATREDITTIFENVRAVDERYAARFSASLSRLTEFKSLVNAVSQIIAPADGVLKSEEIQSFFDEKYEAFTAADEVWKQLSGDGLDVETLKGMEPGERQNLLDSFAAALLAIAPDLKVGGRFELPIGPDASVYYFVRGQVDGNSDYLSVSAIIDNQRGLLKSGQITAKTGGPAAISGSLNSNGGEISASASNTSTSMSFDGVITASVSAVTDKSTYTYKTSFSPRGITAEESVKTDFEGGTVTSAVGIKKKNNDDWKPLPEPVPVETPDEVEVMIREMMQKRARGWDLIFGRGMAPNAVPSWGMDPVFGTPAGMEGWVLPWWLPSLGGLLA